MRHRTLVLGSLLMSGALLARPHPSVNPAKEREISKREARADRMAAEAKAEKQRAQREKGNQLHFEKLRKRELDIAAALDRKGKELKRKGEELSRQAEAHRKTAEDIRKKAELSWNTYQGTSKQASPKPGPDSKKVEKPSEAVKTPEASPAPHPESEPKP